jgi:hypothetical protein
MLVALGALILAPIANSGSLAARAVPQATVVVGTGKPDVDVPIVQAAVDRGGNVILKGHFSFDRLPSIPTAFREMATVRVSQAVAISGTHNEDDEMTSIEGGTIPFYVEAPGASVTIQNVRFVRPTGNGIEVSAVNGLTIASCRFEGTVPVPGTPSTSAIAIVTTLTPPTPAQPGHPENVSGRLVIANNSIDAVGGTERDNKLGITIFSVGQPSENEVDIYVTENQIRNVTEPAINIRRIGGRAHVEGNMITTGPVSSQSAPRPEAIRVVNIGSYVIARNSIDCQWPDPDAMGIGVFSQNTAWPMEHAVVLDNEVTMLSPKGTVFGTLNAGIEIRGFAQDNVIANNRIRGRARAALALDVFNGGIPENNAFALNRFDDFEASRANVFVDVGVTDTLIFGQKGTVEDNGINTVIVPFPRRPLFR